MENSISQLLERAISKLRDRAGHIEREQIEAIATALAVLRPFVPISVLAKDAGVQESAVRSFAADLGRPLSVASDAVQFRDEPTESWFRDKYKPTREALAGFIDTLRPLAEQSSYVASSNHSFALHGVRVYLGAVESNEFDCLSPQRQKAVRAFLGQYLAELGNRPEVQFDGTGIVAQ